MILRVKEKMGELTEQSPEGLSKLKYSVTLGNACSGEGCVQSKPCSPNPGVNVGSRNPLQSKGQAALLGKMVNSLIVKTKCREIPQTCFPEGIRQQLSRKAKKQDSLSPGVWSRAMWPQSMDSPQEQARESQTSQVCSSNLWPLQARKNVQMGR